LLDKIKALLKQTANTPTDYNGLETQIQLFIVTSIIFFGDKSICTMNLWQLILLISRDKKGFCNQIALDKFFAAKFLLQLTGERNNGFACTNKLSILAQK
jgi:hypothetical protein